MTVNHAFAVSPVQKLIEYADFFVSAFPHEVSSRQITRITSALREERAIRPPVDISERLDGYERALYKALLSRVLFDHSPAEGSATRYVVHQLRDNHQYVDLFILTPVGPEKTTTVEDGIELGSLIEWRSKASARWVFIGQKIISGYVDTSRSQSKAHWAACGIPLDRVADFA